MDSKLILGVIVIGLFLFGAWYFWQNPPEWFIREDRVSSSPDIEESNNCEVVGFCDRLTKVDCSLENGASGNVYYVNKYNGKVVAYCGNFCNDQENGYCEQCPPEEWDC